MRMGVYGRVDHILTNNFTAIQEDKFASYYSINKNNVIVFLSV